MYIVQCINCVHYKLYLRYRLYSVEWLYTVYIIIVYSVQCTVYIVQNINGVHCTLYKAYTVYTRDVHGPLYSVHCPLVTDGEELGNYVTPAVITAT